MKLNARAKGIVTAVQQRKFVDRKLKILMVWHVLQNLHHTIAPKFATKELGKFYALCMKTILDASLQKFVMSKLRISMEMIVPNIRSAPNNVVAMRYSVLLVSMKTIVKIKIDVYQKETIWMEIRVPQNVLMFVIQKRNHYAKAEPRPMDAKKPIIVSLKLSEQMERNAQPFVSRIFVLKLESLFLEKQMRTAVQRKVLVESLRFSVHGQMKELVRPLDKIPHVAPEHKLK